MKPFQVHSGVNEIDKLFMKLDFYHVVILSLVWKNITLLPPKKFNPLNYTVGCFILPKVIVYIEVNPLIPVTFQIGKIALGEIFVVKITGLKMLPMTFGNMTHPNIQAYA